MKANKLRIGNLVLNEYLDEKYVVRISPFKVHLSDSGDDDESVKQCKYNEIEPIQLTEDWLLKFGFKKKINKRFGNAEMFQICNKYIIAKPWGENLKLFNNTLSRGFLLDVIYVHQLQNLYFALTGEELLPIGGRLT